MMKYVDGKLFVESKGQMVEAPRMTYSLALEYALEHGDLPKEIADKLSALLAQQEKRNNADKKPTKTQQENEQAKIHVLSVLANCPNPMTVSELMAIDEELGAMSNQKASALIRQLVKEGKVLRSEEKHKAYFSLLME